MDTCETMRVKRKADGAECVINASDFDAEAHTDLSAKAPWGADEKAAAKKTAAKKGGDE